MDNISFTVRKGKTLGLVGESGCGKSTLGRAVLRLTEPSGGEVLYEGKDITKLSSEELRALRKDLQIIFQDPFASLNPRMSIREILSEPFEIHGLYKNPAERRAQIVELLKEVGLNPEAADRYPTSFRAASVNASELRARSLSNPNSSWPTNLSVLWTCLSKAKF